MYAVGWATNTVILTDNDLHTFTETTLETALEMFQDNKPVRLASGISCSALVLDLKVVERRGTAISIRPVGSENPAIIPENAQIQIRRLVRDIPLSEKFAQPLPLNLYSAPLYVKASQVRSEDLVAVPGHMPPDNFCKIVGSCKYEDEVWTEFANSHPRKPFRAAVHPASGNEFDGMMAKGSNKVWRKIASISKLQMDSLVGMTVDSPGGIICDGVIIQAMIASCAKVP